jgi:hypothetical protein
MRVRVIYFPILILSALIPFSTLRAESPVEPLNHDDPSIWEKIWLEAKPGIFLMEAEDLIHADNEQAWKFDNTNKGWSKAQCQSAHGDLHYTTFHGRGYLEVLAAGGSDGHYDNSGSHQLSFEQRLYMPVMIETPGYYWVELNALHYKHDGDNDIWINKLPYDFSKDGPLERNGCQHHANCWSTDNRLTRWHCDKGLNVFYIAGRDRGYSIDRVQIFHFDGEKRNDPNDWKKGDTPEFHEARKMRLQEEWELSPLLGETGSMAPERSDFIPQKPVHTMAAVIEKIRTEARSVVLYTLTGAATRYSGDDMDGALSTYRNRGLQLVQVETKDGATEYYKIALMN